MEMLGRPTEPLLASQVLSDEELDTLMEGWGDGGIRQRRDGAALLRAGVKSLDDALDGGLRAGTVVGVSSEAGGGGSAVSSVH